MERDTNYNDFNDFYPEEISADDLENGWDWEDDYDDSMDGDHDSAMASAGHGTDEDYGYYGDPEMENDYGYEDFHSDDGLGYYDDGE